MLTCVAVAAACRPGAAAGEAIVERFSYETLRVGDPARKPQERVSLVTRIDADGFTAIYRSDHLPGHETATIRMNCAGDLLFAEKEEYDSRGGRTVYARMWRDDESVYIERAKGDATASLRRRALNGADLIADAGLLVRLRFFPFDSGRDMVFLMAGFPQHFVTMRARQAGRECIEVPAGRFECYRIEATINLFIKEFKMTYWLSVDPPHFLVRYEGKRGLFLAPTFVTSLTSYDLGREEAEPADGPTPPAAGGGVPGDASSRD